MGGHDEVVLVKAFDFVGPPVNLDSPPLDDEFGVMILVVGGLGNTVGESHGFGVVFEFEGFL